MESTGAQQIFFGHIKGLLPQHISFVDEIAEVLNISNDSAYRRIRGEKSITLEEIKKLCTTFKISLDSYFISILILIYLRGLLQTVQILILKAGYNLVSRFWKL